MKKKKLFVFTAVTALSAIVVCGCGQKESELTTITPPTVTEMTAPQDITMVKDGMILNDLTGEWIDESYKDIRPIGIMINNLDAAMPQSGIAQADIINEMIVEGGITRLEAIFTQYDQVEKLGPVRSARQYYIRVADEYDAIFTHIGTSTLADAELASSGIDHMDGMSGLGNVFIYRDNSRNAPHNAYTSGEKLKAAIDQGQFRTTHDEGYEKKFKFNTKDTDLTSGKPANKIITEFNASRKPYFEYNATEKVYERYQYGDRQIDDQTNDILKFKNIIIQFAAQYSVDGYLMEVETESSGNGFYATNGTIIPITWEKVGNITKYYDESGEQLKLNPGKTWITYFDTAIQDSIIVE